jgi:hypothetical protein
MSSPQNITRIVVPADRFTPEAVKTVGFFPNAADPKKKALEMKVDTLALSLQEESILEKKTKVVPKASQPAQNPKDLGDMNESDILFS